MKRRFLLPIVGLALFGTLASCGDNTKPEEQKETEKVSITVVNGSGTGSYEKGKQVTIVANVQEGKTFLNWTKNGQIVSLSMSYTFTASEDAVYFATYTNEDTDNCKITVEGGSGSGTYKKGNSATLVAQPQEGKVFVGWVYKGDIVSTDLSYTFVVTESGTYIAVFKNEDQPQKVTITVEGGSGSGSYEIGASVTIVTEPQQGKEFIGWVHNGNIVSTDLSYTFIVTEAGTYTASFKSEEPKMVTITVEGGGGSGTYEIGTTITISAMPVQGKTFIGWKHGGIIVSTSLDYTFTVTEGGIYTATFSSEGIENYERVVTKKSNQDFKILNFTDVQLHDGEDYTIAQHVIDTLVTREQPDFIVFLGDLLNDHRTYKSIENAKKFIAQVDSYDIPWAPIFGNHDYEDYQTGYQSAKTTTSSDLANWYSQADNCVFTLGPSEISGKSNYFVTVKDETTQKPVQTLVFLDSRLSGLSDEHDTFYREIINYSKEQNDGEIVPSTVFTHIALPQYGDEYEKARQCDYANITGSINRDPCDLASGTKLLFPSMKELGSTDMVVCGHDHENAYYTVKDGITLAYSMKSSQGDNYTNFAELGGSLITIDDESKNFRYVKDLSNPMNLTGTNDKKGDYPTFPDTLPNWRFSGAKLCFDIEVPEAGGSLKFNIEGTNIYRPNQDEKTRLGEWNRLTKNVDITGGASATADFGTLTKKEGYKYSYELDLTKIPLNDSGGEESYGSETARLVYFNSIVGNFKVTNLRYEMENITEKDQIDLATATVDPIAVQFTNGGLPVRPTPTVKVGGQKLAFADDFYVAFENNFESGTAKGTILPSGKGAHKYKGYKEFTFELVENPDDDKVPGHENATLVESNYTFEGKTFVGDLGIKDWYNGDKVLQFDVKPLVYGKVHDGETARFALFGRNENLPASEVNNWNRFTTYYHIDFSTKSIHITNETAESSTVCHFVDIGDGWYQVSMPLNKFKLNDGALGNDKETIKLIYIEYVKRSFKIGNFKVIGGEEEPEKSFEFKMNDSEFVVANFTDIHVDNESLLGENGTTGKTIKYGVENCNPDIMVFSGDIAGKAADVTTVCDFLDQFKIPYFFILGNHDHEGSLGYDAISTRVNESQYGHIEYGPSYLNSQGNYTIQIKNSSDELVHGLILMDTGNKCSTQGEPEYVQNPVAGVPYASYNGKQVYCNPGWNGLRGNQIDWYEKKVQKFGCETTLICHIPLLEHVKAYEQYKDAVNRGDSTKIAECAPIGPCHMGESSCGSMEQLGMFDAIKRNGSTKNVICGHDHVNDFSLMYQGVRLTYAVKTGEGSYWKTDGSICGYTKLVIDSQGKTTLDQVFYNPLTH